ncbi:MAG: 5'/3'-nucleotidase SurE [Rickettsiales bacterium]|jgi:5'-nucleotidase
MHRILITNDDGINAEGLKVLERIALEISNDVWVVAPEVEQSGAAHSLTLHLPVRVRKIAPKRFAVSGTPTDCVLLALQEIMRLEKKPVTLLLSGVNHGSNVGDDVTYSGTIAAAMEGTILNIPSIALSLMGNGSDELNWQTAEKYAPEIIKKLIDVGWRENTLINMNFPDCDASKVLGVKVCPQGKRIVNIKLSERNDPKGRPYFWLGGDRDNTPKETGVDIDYLRDNYITVTPICMDLTDYQSMEKISAVF